MSSMDPDHAINFDMNQETNTLRYCLLNNINLTRDIVRDPERSRSFFPLKKKSRPTTLITAPKLLSLFKN